ncbi:MAG: hypothetical protein SFV17_02705 [Candidatus Obscuribacter sp.]|nr:hypothetical protein [Candidatus Melainabacteria bacterium]MDX1985573.1 hypothetical protein [Candidatus Obscuribacter sp.]
MTTFSPRKFSRPIVHLLLASLAGCSLLPVYSADKSADKDFEQFFAQFKQAISRADREKVADLTKLPYMLQSKTLNRQQFIAQFNAIFPPAHRKCLVKEKPIKDQQCYMVFCGEEIFIFARVDGKYKFTEIGVND